MQIESDSSFVFILNRAPYEGVTLHAWSQSDKNSIYSNGMIWKLPETLSDCWMQFIKLIQIIKTLMQVKLTSFLILVETFLSSENKLKNWLAEGVNLITQDESFSLCAKSEVWHL